MKEEPHHVLYLKEHFYVYGRKYMMTFAEYCQYQESLWLNDKNAIVGLSKTAPPTAPKIKPVHAPAPPKLLVKAQFPDAPTMIRQLGISPVEPDKDRMRRLVDGAKKQVIIPTPWNITKTGRVAD